jgi:hypothetical protein
LPLQFFSIYLTENEGEETDAMSEVSSRPFEVREMKKIAQAALSFFSISLSDQRNGKLNINKY